MMAIIFVVLFLRSSVVMPVERSNGCFFFLQKCAKRQNQICVKQNSSHPFCVFEKFVAWSCKRCPHTERRWMQKRSQTGQQYPECLAEKRTQSMCSPGGEHTLLQKPAPESPTSPPPSTLPLQAAQSQCKWGVSVSERLRQAHQSWIRKYYLRYFALGYPRLCLKWVENTDEPFHRNQPNVNEVRCDAGLVEEKVHQTERFAEHINTIVKQQQYFSKDVHTWNNKEQQETRGWGHCSKLGMIRVQNIRFAWPRCEQRNHITCVEFRNRCADSSGEGKSMKTKRKKIIEPSRKEGRNQFHRPKLKHYRGSASGVPQNITQQQLSETKKPLT